MGTCEDITCQSSTVTNEINLPIDTDGVHQADRDDDSDTSSEQALAQNLESIHLVEEGQIPEEKVQVSEPLEEDKEIEGDGEEGENDKEKEEDWKNGDGNTDHPFPLRPEAEVCSFYIKAGTCIYGSSCRFNHPLNRINQLADVDSRENDGQGTNLTGKIECKYYLTPEGCKYGNNCRYSHSKGNTNDEPAELNFLGLPIRLGERECPYYMHNGSCGYGANCRYHHPEPTATAEEPRNLIGNSGAVQVGNSFSARNNAELALPMSSIRSPSMPKYSRSENVSSFAHFSVPQGTPQLPGYNQYHFPHSLQDNNAVSSRPSRSGSGLVKKSDSFGYSQQLLQNEEFPERPGQPDCDFFMKTGTCKYRFSCKYHHPRSRSHTMPNGVTHNPMRGANYLTHHTQTIQLDEYPERPGQPECTYFMKTGDCKYKSACKYHHPKGQGRGSKVAAPSNVMYSLPSGSVPIPSHKLYPSRLNQGATLFIKNQQAARIEEFPERPGQPECEHFIKTGDCKYKYECRYHHPKRSRNQVPTTSEFSLSEKGLPLRPGARICRNYEQLGICKYGPRCLFDHPANYESLAGPESPTSPQYLPGNNGGSENWGDSWDT